MILRLAAGLFALVLMSLAVLAQDEANPDLVTVYNRPIVVLRANVYGISPSVRVRANGRSSNPPPIQDIRRFQVRVGFAPSAVVPNLRGAQKGHERSRL